MNLATVPTWNASYCAYCWGPARQRKRGADRAYCSDEHRAADRKHEAHVAATRAAAFKPSKRRKSHVALTVQEASAVNTLLTALYGPLQPDHTLPSPEQLDEASKLLAKSANDKLHAGYRPEQVLAASR